MPINGKVFFEPDVADASAFRIRATATSGRSRVRIEANLERDGSFRLDGPQLDRLRAVDLAILRGGRTIASRGPYTREAWREILLRDVPSGTAERPREEAAREEAAWIVSGLVVDLGAGVGSFAGYRLSATYGLISPRGFQVKNRALAALEPKGTFRLTLAQDAASGMRLDPGAPLGLSLADPTGRDTAFACFIVEGERRRRDQAPKPADLGGGERTRPPVDPRRLRATALPAQLPAAHLELQIRSATEAPRPVAVARPEADNNRRVRGRAVEKTGTIKIRDCQVILYGANPEARGAAAARVLAVCTTDGEGNFSAPYPRGAFASARAVVGVKPDEPKDIVLAADGTFPDFLWLILESLPPGHDQEKHDACACAGGATPPLPDMDELVQNNAYTQDVGGSCVNFTTPNRALEEYVYKVVVRTSDPELFNLDEATLTARRREVEARIAYLEQRLNLLMATLLEVRPISDAVRESIAQLVKPVTVRASNAASPGAAHVAVDQPARQLLGHSVFNANAELIRVELASLRSLAQMLKRLSDYKGRVPLDGSNPIDWDDSDDTLGVVQASTIAHGHILNLKQVWRAAGYSLGDLVYSLPLAPGQKKQIAVFDWDRRESASRSEALDYADSLSNAMSHSRDINEIVNSNLSESETASSHNKSEGRSSGFGVGAGTSGSAAAAGSYSGFSVIGAATAMFGLSGGSNKSSGESWSDASQNAMRNLAASSNQGLRDSTMQNASSVRSQRSSVVTTVGQNESFSVTTEVVANHNHCHALTIQYFEVLRHYAIYQELADVQECLFIPMFIGSFDARKILRWRDILSTYLLAPSHKIAQLRAGFDALQRQQDDLRGDPDAYADFPLGRYCDEPVADLSGTLKLRLYVVRPAWTIPSAADATLEQKKAALIQGMNDGGLSWLPGINEIAERLVNGLSEKIEENFQKELIWGQAAEEYVKRLSIRALTAGTGVEQDLRMDVSLVSKIDMGVDPRDPARSRAGHFDLTVTLRRTAATPPLARSDIASIVVRNDRPLPFGSSCLVVSGFLRYGTEHYAGALFANDTINDDIAFGDTALVYTPLSKDELRNPRKEDQKNAKLLSDHLNTNREHYHTKLWMMLDERRLFNLLDKYSIPVPKLRYATGVKDGDSVYGLLLDADGNAVVEDENRSVASVVELKRVGLAGNSIIFPVARGLNLNRDFLLVPEYTTVDGVALPGSAAPGRIGVVDGASRVSLVDLYKPLPGTTQEPKPYRVSVPTKGLFAEAVPGACNSCEKIDDSRFWKWEEHPIDEPTAIQPIGTDSRRADPGNLAAKDFPAPMINIQAAPAAPDPQGLANALMLMGKSDIFRDFTGLDQTQKNALQSLLSNQEAAKFFAQQAAALAIESGRQTQHAADTVASYDLAKRGQTMQALDKIGSLPVDADTKQKYYDQALGKILDDDAGASDTLKQSAAAETARQGIVDQTSIDHHADQGRDVEASRTVGDTTETVKITGRTGAGTGPSDTGSSRPGGKGPGEDGPGEADARWNVVPVKQPNNNACWAAAATMMVSWKQDQSLDVEDVLQQAGPNWLALYQQGGTLKVAQKDAFIGALGMVGEPPAEYVLAKYVALLKQYGPLWVTTDAAAGADFSPHARILSAVAQAADGDGGGAMLTFADPATGTSATEPFLTFTKAFDEVAAGTTGALRAQIVRFKDPVPADEGEGRGKTPAKTPGLANTVRPIPQDAAAAISAEEQALTGGGYQLGALIAAGTFARAKIGANAPTNYSFRRYDGALFVYDADVKRVHEVHGKIYEVYKKAGFSDVDGSPASTLGLPSADETVWSATTGAQIGRRSVFTRGVAYYRQRDFKVVSQLIDTDHLRYWGIDGTETFSDIVGGGHSQGRLLDKVGAYPCFKALYVPRNDQQARAKASEVHDIFTETMGLTRVFIVDNIDSQATGHLHGEQNGRSDAARGCQRAATLLKRYVELPPVRQRLQSLAGTRVLLARDIEPGVTPDVDYLRGYGLGVRDFNNAANAAQGAVFVCCYYMTFDTTGGRNNGAIVDQLVDGMAAKPADLFDFELWAQHPNRPKLMESRIFENGMTPLEPAKKKASLWQFNNYDARFPHGSQFWFDHDLATAAAFDLLWQANEDLYKT